MDFAKIQHGDFFINKIYILFYVCVCCLRRGRGRGREGVKIDIKKEREWERKEGGGERAWDEDYKIGTQTYSNNFFVP